MSRDTTINIIMLMFTVSICLLMVSPALLELLTDYELSEAKAKVLSGVVVTIISIISAFIVNSLKQPRP